MSSVFNAYLELEKEVAKLKEIARDSTLEITDDMMLSHNLATDEVVTKLTNLNLNLRNHYK